MAIVSDHLVRVPPPAPHPADLTRVPGLAARVRSAATTGAIALRAVAAAAFCASDAPGLDDAGVLRTPVAQERSARR
jgi:hypothetical protein